MAGAALVQPALLATREGCMRKPKLVGCVLGGAAALSALTSSFLVPAAAQDAPLRPVRVVIASSKRLVAADPPLYFRLLQASLPAERSAAVPAVDGFVFVTSGSVVIAAGTERQTVAEGEGRFI